MSESLDDLDDFDDLDESEFSDTTIAILNEMEAKKPVDPSLLFYAEGVPPAKLCEKCSGSCMAYRRRKRRDKTGFINRLETCVACNGIGYIGIDEPWRPTICLPGSAGKRAVLTARYAGNVEEFHNPQDARHNQTQAFNPDDAAMHEEVEYVGGE